LRFNSDSATIATDQPPDFYDAPTGLAGEAVHACG
jgi:hypothetical protein